MAGKRNNYGKQAQSQSDYGDNGGNKRINPGDDRNPFTIGPDDTVYIDLYALKERLEV